MGIYALRPTAEIVAATQAATINSVSLPPDSWTEVRSLTVPDEDHESLFVHATFQYRLNAAGSPGIGWVRARLKHNSDYYPNSTGLDVTGYFTSGDDSHCASFLFHIPKNIKGEPVKLEVYNDHPTRTRSAEFVYMKCWGDTPHKHQ